MAFSDDPVSAFITAARLILAEQDRIAALPAPTIDLLAGERSGLLVGLGRAAAIMAGVLGGYSGSPTAHLRTVVRMYDAGQLDLAPNAETVAAGYAHRRMEQLRALRAESAGAPCGFEWWEDGMYLRACTLASGHDGMHRQIDPETGTDVEQPKAAPGPEDDPDDEPTDEPATCTTHLACCTAHLEDGRATCEVCGASLDRNSQAISASGDYAQNLGGIAK